LEKPRKGGARDSLEPQRNTSEDLLMIRSGISYSKWTSIRKMLDLEED